MPPKYWKGKFMGDRVANFRLSHALYIEALESAGHNPYIYEVTLTSEHGSGKVARMRCSRCHRKWHGWLVHPLFGLSPRRVCQPRDRPPSFGSDRAAAGMIVMGVVLLLLGAFLLLVFVDGMLTGPEDTGFYILGFTVGAAMAMAGAWLFRRGRRRRRDQQG